MARTPTAKSTSSGASARARLAAERAQAEQRRRRLFWVAVPVAVVLVAVGALVSVRYLGGGPSRTPAAAASPASDSVITAVTSVPAAVLDQVGVGAATAPPKALNGPALTENGLPKVLYVGAEYCPYCAAERWAMVVALSRFGTFTGLGQTTSAAQDVYPSTPTLTFHGSSYTSTSLVFTGVETETNQPAGSGYAPLDTLTGADQQTFSTYDRPPYVSSAGSIPFVDIGGKYVISGASYDPQVLQGHTHAEIAGALADPTSDIAQSVDGTANLITAAICASTGDKPAAVCGSAGVRAAAQQLG